MNRILFTCILLCIASTSNAGGFVLLYKNQPAVQTPIESKSDGDSSYGSTTFTYKDGSKRIVYNNGDYTVRDYAPLAGLTEARILDFNATEDYIEFGTYVFLGIIIFIWFISWLCSFKEDNYSSTQITSTIRSNKKINIKKPESLVVICPDCKRKLRFNNPPKGTFRCKCNYCNRQLEIE